MLKNYMEIMVEEALPSILEKEDIDCRCEICKEDVQAIALNNLQPIYVVTEKGILYTRLNEFNAQFKVDIIREITKAIKKVKENPRH